MRGTRDCRTSSADTPFIGLSTEIGKCQRLPAKDLGFRRRRRTNTDTCVATVMIVDAIPTPRSTITTLAIMSPRVATARGTSESHGGNVVVNFVVQSDSIVLRRRHARVSRATREFSPRNRPREVTIVTTRWRTPLTRHRFATVMTSRAAAISSVGTSPALGVNTRFPGLKEKP